MADLAEQWLKENDPAYSTKEKLEHPYFSERLMRKKREKELPTDPSIMERQY